MPTALPNGLFGKEDEMPEEQEIKAAKEKVKEIIDKFMDYDVVAGAGIKREDDVFKLVIRVNKDLLELLEDFNITINGFPVVFEQASVVRSR